MRNYEFQNDLIKTLTLTTPLQGRSKGRAAGAAALSAKFKRAQIW